MTQEVQGTPQVRTVTWTGRYPELAPEGAAPLDGWNAPNTRLGRLLGEADRLVVLDAISFPWGYISWDSISVEIELPDLGSVTRSDSAALALAAAGAVTESKVRPDIATLDALLGRVVFSRFTYEDRLRTDDEELRAFLTDKYLLPDVVWSDTIGDGDRKFMTYAKAAAVADEALAAVPPLPQLAIVGMTGDDGRVAHRMRQLLRRPEARIVHEHEAGSSLDSMPSADCSVVLLDEGHTGDHLMLTVRRALSRLEPGGHLILVATVVGLPGRPVVPSISGLIEQIDRAAHGAVQVHEIRSLRWPGENLHRGVLMRFASLGLREDW